MLAASQILLQPHHHLILIFRHSFINSVAESLFCTMNFFLLALAGTALAAPQPLPQVKLDQRSAVRRSNGTLSSLVSGTPPGFASSVTGGGDAAAVTPTSTAELTQYLGDTEARVIVLTQTFDYSDSEGTKTSSGCSPWGTAAGCQIAIDANSWCENYEPNAPTVSSITYNAAGVEGITVASDKTIIGSGTSGVIKGKGCVHSTRKYSASRWT